MKSLISIIAISIFSINSYSQVHVKGYYRKDGTYVQPHVRSNPDGNPYNNYSYPGNYNPYTGKTAGGADHIYLNRNTNSSSSYVNGYSYDKYVSAPPISERNYIKDKKGCDVMYDYVVEETKLYRSVIIYNMNDIQIGTATEYYDGDLFIYDNNENLLSRKRGKKKHRP